MRGRVTTSSMQFIRYGDGAPPWIEAVGKWSSAQHKKLESLGFVAAVDGRLWAPLKAFGRTNASALRVMEVLSEHGIDALVTEDPSDEGNDDVDQAEQQIQGSERGEEEDAVESAENSTFDSDEFADALVDRILAVTTSLDKSERHWQNESNRRISVLEDRIAILERHIANLTDDRHPSVGRAILVSQPPERFRCGGREVVLDTARNIPVAALPEEDVRQRTLRHLIEYLGYPAGVLASEWALRRQFAGTSERADIIVMWPAKSGTGEVEFAAVIECKRPGWPLNDDVWEQVTRYAAKVGARIAAVTDGESLLTRVRTESGDFVPADRFPAFHSLQTGGLPPEVYEIPRGIRRPSYEDLTSREELNEYEDIISADLSETTIQHRATIVNLASLLMDPFEVARPRPLDNGWKLVRDRGLIDTNFGNAGFTSHAYSGLYRGLIVEDPDGNTVLPLLRVWSVQYSEHGRPAPMLAVAFHRIDERKRNHALQLNLAKHILIEPGHFKIVHDGRIALGEGGAVSGAETRRHVSVVLPDLVRGNRIEIGRLPHDRLIRWDNFVPVAIRLIRYALACEDVRAQARNERV